MDIFLWCLTGFNLVAGAAALVRGLRLWSPTAREAWQSTRLYYLAIWIACSMPVVAGAFTVLAWWAPTAAAAAPLILAPIAWLMVMGLIFAVIDFAEDGRFNLGQRSR
jgi:hypothetical protein